MNHDERWRIHFWALMQYSSRYGDACPPTDHIEILDGKEIRLGNWVSYMRSRYHKGLLSDTRVRALESNQTWTWGPVRPGPKSKAVVASRNEEIVALRKQGLSLREIGDKFDLTRQRVHQILNGE